ncbi:heat-inducible transcriptional repressor HrcA [Mycoplasmopsis opalescens]|uniref:heat-inducible transcriptional repressor HrcA n=1 Tax=Mycoplasmopsis opalescens TaxID=114886 RepID=UPI0004A71CDC|nr:heat-inducible transcriptional repressor HrcA [Mycoplasmopsis opalescens]
MLYLHELDPEERQLLRLIVEDYISTGIPIGSKYLIETHGLKMSSAKARYIMKDLEDKGYLQKTHTSSGRIPSNIGYNYYAEFLVSKDTEAIKNHISDIFAKRRVGIETTIQEAANIISDAAGITLVTSETNEDATLKSIQLVPLTENQATVILVTSYGEVSHKTIKFSSRECSMDDLRIAIRVFKERLINVPILQLPIYVKSISPILANYIKNYEGLIHNFVTEVFNFELKNKNIVYGKGNIILADEISRTDLTKILHYIETESIWKTIEKHFDDDSNIRISVNPDHSAIITKKLQKGGKITEISAIGTDKMDYRKSLSALQLLEEIIEQDEKGRIDYEH